MASPFFARSGRKGAFSVYCFLQMGWYSGSEYCLPINSLFLSNELIGETMKSHKKTITMLLTAAVLLTAVFMTGCIKLSEVPVLRCWQYRKPPICWTKAIKSS